MSIIVNNLFFDVDEGEGSSDEEPEINANYLYYANDQFYTALTLHATVSEQNQLIFPFTVDLNRSRPIILLLERGLSDSVTTTHIGDYTQYTPMIYQWNFVENRLIEITSRPGGYQTIIRIDEINVPMLPDNQHPGRLSWYDLLHAPDNILNLLNEFVNDEYVIHTTSEGITIDIRFVNGITDEIFDQIIRLESPPSRDSLTYTRLMIQYLQDRELDERESLMLQELLTQIPIEPNIIHKSISKKTQDSYEMLLCQLYNLPIEKKISLTDILNLQNIEIDKWIIDPLLQPYAELPYKIITLYDKNGTTYLVKAQYDSSTNRIF